MYCSKCGKENPDNGKFCSACGASLAGKIVPKTRAPSKISEPVCSSTAEKSKEGKEAGNYSWTFSGTFTGNCVSCRSGMVA